MVPSNDAGKLQGHGNARPCLKVDDISAAIADLHARGVRTGDAEPKANSILAKLHDPDGNGLCLWQYVR